VRIFTWVLCILIAIAFLLAAFFKFIAAPMEVQAFNLFGLPIWFMYVIAVVELVSAVGLLIPRYASLAAALAACNMLGALTMHLTHGQTAAASVPFVLLIASIAVIFLRGGIRQFAIGNSPG
jgi:putative oxidoreductase